MAKKQLMGAMKQLLEKALPKIQETAKAAVETITGTADKGIPAETQQLDQLGEAVAEIAKGRTSVKATQKAMNILEAKAVSLSERARVEISKAFTKEADDTVISGVSSKLRSYGIDISESSIKKARKKAAGSGEGAEQDLKEIELGFKKRVVAQYKKKILDPIAVDLTAETMSYGGKEVTTNTILKVFGGGRKLSELNKMVEEGRVHELLAGASPSKTLRYTQEMHKNVLASRALRSKNMDKATKMNWVERYFLPIDEKASVAADYAQLKGDVFMVEHLRNFYKTVNEAQAFEGVTKLVENDIIGTLKKYDPERRQNIVRYINERKPEDVIIPSKMEGLNTPARMDLNKAKELGLEIDDIRAANRVHNSFRLLHEMAYNKYNNKFSVERFYEQAKNIEKHDNGLYAEGSNFSYGSVGDFGSNYFPLIPNEEHKKKILDAIEAGDPLKAAMKRNNFHEVDYAIWASRTKDSELSQDITKTMDPVDTVKSYVNKYVNSHIYSDGKARIELIKRAASLTDPAGTTKGMERRDMRLDYKLFIDDIEKHWEEKFAGSSMPESKFAKAMSAWADANTAVIIGLNPKMALFNTAQFIADGQFKPFSETLRSIIKAPSVFKKFGVEVANGELLEGLTNQTHVNNAMRKLAEGIKDPLYRKVLMDYNRNEQFDVLQTGLVEMTPFMQKFFNFVTPMFQLSDYSSRVHGLFSSASFAESVYNKIGRESLMKGTDSSIEKLTKQLHLYRFNKFAREDMLRYVKNPDEFISAFSRHATRQEMFNYHKIFRPELLDKMGNNWATARVARFMSWPMHYTSYLRGVAKAYENGDNAPAKALAFQSVLWYSTFNAVGGAGIPVVSDIADYGSDRGPLIGTAKNVVSTSLKFGGMLSAPLGATLFPVFKTEEVINSALRGGNNKFDYTTKEVYNNAKSNPAWRKGKWLFDFIDSEE